MSLNLLRFLRLYRIYNGKEGVAGWHGWLNLPGGYVIFRGLDGKWSPPFESA